MFEIQTYDKNEWINRWTVQDERGKPRPCRFKTYTEALKYLCDFLETKHSDGWYLSLIHI